MVAKDSVPCRHICGGVFARYCLRRAIRNGVKSDSLVDFFQQCFVERVLRVLHHILERLKVVEHFEGLEKGFSRRNHTQPFLLQLAGVIHGKRVALDGA